jgi:alkylhydroperoxidase AhpD family core domain
MPSAAKRHATDIRRSRERKMVEIDRLTPQRCRCAANSYARCEHSEELLYVAVSVTNNCGYRVASHTAAARRAGMIDEMFGRAAGGGRHGERD